MKRSVCLFVLTLFWVSVTQATITRVEVSPASPRTIDPVTITVTGYFTDGCWSVDRTTLDVADLVVDLEIHAIDVSDLDVSCPLALVDYVYSFSLGKLPEGVFSLRVLESHVSIRSPEGQVDLSEFSVSGPTGIGDDGTVLPLQHTLEQNTPNPFNPRTMISYTLFEPDWVVLSIYDVQGRRVARLPRIRHDRGLHRVVWDGMLSLGGPAPTGVYFYRIATSNGSLTRKMMLLR